MALLTEAQATLLWDNAYKKVKVKLDGAYYRTRVHSIYNGFHYYIDFSKDGLPNGNGTEAEIRTACIDFWQTQENKGTDPLGTETSI